MKHTKGEWKAKNILGYPRMHDHPHVVSEKGDVIVRFGGGNVEEVEANAKLIAAAPELLAALKAFVEDYSGAGDLKYQNAVAAIKKATE